MGERCRTAVKSAEQRRGLRVNPDYITLRGAIERRVATFPQLLLFFECRLIHR